MAVLEELQNKEEEEEFLEQVEQFKRDVAEERKKYEPSTAEKIFSGRLPCHKLTKLKSRTRRAWLGLPLWGLGGGGGVYRGSQISVRIPDATIKKEDGKMY
jgi:hypothetical protein